MSDERWQRVEDLFHQAVSLSPDERHWFLADACGTDRDLQRQVESLLAHDDGTNPLERAIAAAIDRVPQDFTTHNSTAADYLPGVTIGPYHLLELIGQGGMGEVWTAKQERPVRRQVALKLIKAGMDTREVVARFESERQALALMDHPAIARVFEAGSTQQNRPYFAMEYVAGIPITAYCDKHRLTTRERLELFIRVCDGVQHAHQKAIIHRDLKPSNILVTEVDGKPAPKIIDFGVAKATAQPLTAETLHTRMGALLGTPEYMSPEQADSAGQDIDTRTDVYSLGVVLYELLVGALPLELHNLSFMEMLRKLREGDTARPSTKVRTLGERSTAAAGNRRTDTRTLARQLRGDLDAIVLKAVEKDRSRRYGTPSELAADIGRYLRNEPVVAHAPSVAYRGRKYLRRHRIAVSVAAGLIVMLAAFAVLQTIQLRRITRERDRADRITTFMTRMFRVSNPSEARGNRVTAREVLDRASNDINTGLAHDPALQSEMMEVMGGVYTNLGLYARAESLFRRSVELRRRMLGPNNPATLRSVSGLSSVLRREAHYAEAEKLESQTLQLQRRILGSSHPDTLESMNILATIFVYERRAAEAERLYREALDGQRRVLGPDHFKTLQTEMNLATFLQRRGALGEAEKLQREIVDMQRRALGPENQDTLNSMGNLANTLSEEGRYTQAEKLQQDTLNLRRRILGPEHPDTLDTMMDLGNTLAYEGRYVEAESLVRESLEIRRKVLGPDHPDLSISLYNLAVVEALWGKKEEAISLLRQAVDKGGGRDVEFGLAMDPSLNSLRGNSDFAALVAYAKKKNAAASQSKLAH